MSNQQTSKNDDFDLITFEVLRNALAAAADEMALMVMRSARSSVAPSRVRPPRASGRSCFGRSGRLHGQKRSPRPPARIRTEWFSADGVNRTSGVYD